MLKHLKELTALPGISGREDAVREYVLRALRECRVPLDIRTDALGNILVEVTGKKRAEHRVLFEAHMDEVGLMVTGITAEGYLRFAEVGGINEKVLVGRTVTVNGQVGVIGCKAFHHCDKEELTKSVPVDRLLIDIGADSREEAEKVVSVGDMVVFDSAYTDLFGGKLKAKALDDRAGCALLLSLLEEELPYDITVAFTVQEEIGLRGAKVAANVLEPDIAVTVEATTASDIAGTKSGQEVCFLNNGLVLSFMDSHTLYDQQLYRHILHLAQSRGIPVQPKTVVAGGNNAGAIQTAGRGVRVAAVSLPCRYIHSAGCVLAEEDIKAVRRLLCLLAETLPGECP